MNEPDITANEAMRRIRESARRLLNLPDDVELSADDCCLAVDHAIVLLRDRGFNFDALARELGLNKL